MKQKTAMLFDGKSINPWDVDDPTGWTPLGGNDHDTTEAFFFRNVPWLYRAVQDRANNVGKMPFLIKNGEEEIDSSASYTDKIECMPSPSTLFKKIEMSLTMENRAYIKKEMNSTGYVKGLKYFVPTSITEIYWPDSGKIKGVEHVAGEIRHYERQANNKKYILPVEEIIAIYAPDYSVEIGPGKSSPAKAALSSAGVLFNIDTFVSAFFERGAIKATILTVDGNVAEAKKLQTWWDKVGSGVKNAFTNKVLNAKTVTPTVIGEGIEGLQNEELTNERRLNIATALGIPESRMWSAAANFATRVQDDKAYYESTIIPECDLIAEAFNTELFIEAHHMEKYKLVFDYETLDVFQVDAQAQATAFISLASKLPLVISADLSGLDLTDEQRAALDKIDKEPKPEPVWGQSPNQPAQEDEKVPDETEEDLRKWYRKASKRLKAGKGAECEFDSEYIPLGMNGAIEGALEGCETEQQLKAIFQSALEWKGYP